MSLTNAGTTLLAAAAVGATYTPYNNANANIGVGDSTAAFAKTQTGLQASSNTYFQPMDTGFPTASGTTLVFQATFGLTVANFAWQEIGLFNAPSSPGTAGSGTMLNRFLQSVGTKLSSQSWQLVVTITVTNP
jgi:hypothetical protein